MKYKKAYFAVCVISLAACAQLVSPPDMAATPSLEISPTEVEFPATVPATPSPSLTSIPTLAGTLEPFPAVSEKLMTSTYFNDTSICELPCWNGVVVGKSRLADAQAAMESVFGLSESQAMYASETGKADTPEQYYVEYLWNSPDDASEPDKFNGLLGVRFFIERTTTIVKRIGIYWVNDTPGVQIHRTLGDVLRSSDRPPTYISVRFNQSERADIVESRVSVDYQDGYGAGFTSSLVVSKYNNNGQPLEGLLCLDTEFEGFLYVVEPFTDNQNNLPQLQELSEYSPQQIYDLALTQPNSCVPVRIESGK